MTCFAPQIFLLKSLFKENTSVLQTEEKCFHQSALCKTKKKRERKIAKTFYVYVSQNFSSLSGDQWA